MVASFTQKALEIKIVLAKGSFGGEGNTLILNDFSMSASIEKAGLPDKSKAKVKIFGLSLEKMEQLTLLSFRALEADNNVISIAAGIKGQELSTVFQGEITSSFANFATSPDVSLDMDCMSAYYPSLIPSPPRSFQGSVPVADIISSFAKEAGYNFENMGFSGNLLNPVFNGNPIDNAWKAAKQVGANLIIDDNVITLLKSDQKSGEKAPLLTPETGLIGYPTFNNDGIVLKCLYSKDLIFNGIIEVKSIVPKATGLWRITKLSHTLSANNPSSQDWFSSVEATFYEG